MSRRVAVVAVVALVALAGCSGGSLGGPTGASDATADGAATSTEAPKTTLPDVTEQPWVYGNETVAYERLFDAHEAALANASSFVFSRHSESNTGATTQSRIAVRNDAQRANLSVTTSFSNTTRIQNTFVANGTVYAESGTADDRQYSRDDQNLTGEAFDEFVAEQSRIQVPPGVLQAFTFEYAGTAEGAYVFEADSVRPSDETSFDAENVTAASATLVVDGDGFVRELSISLTVDGPDGEASATATVRATGVNETTVVEPSWTDEAA
jgi:hypothetical protein